LDKCAQLHADLKAQLEQLHKDEEQRQKVTKALKQLGALTSEQPTENVRAANKSKAASSAKTKLLAWGKAKAPPPPPPPTKSSHEYKAMLTQLGQLNLGGLIPLVDALDSKRSLFGVSLSSVDSM